MRKKWTQSHCVHFLKVFFNTFYYRCVLNILFLVYLQARKTTFRPLLVFIRCKVSSFISHDARITPSSTYTFHSTKIQKSTRHNF